jgi:hypothetical protein
LDKPTVEVTESKEELDSLDSAGLFPVVDSLGLVWVDFYALGTNNKA